MPLVHFFFFFILFNDKVNIVKLSRPYWNYQRTSPKGSKELFSDSIFWYKCHKFTRKCCILSHSSHTWTCSLFQIKVDYEQSLPLTQYFSSFHCVLQWKCGVGSGYSNLSQLYLKGRHFYYVICFHLSFFLSFFLYFYGIVFIFF